MVTRQWTGRLRRGHRRRQPDAPLSRPADRPTRAAARPPPGVRQDRGGVTPRHPVLGTRHQSLGGRCRGAAGVCAHRVVSSRGPHARLALRGRRAAPRAAHLARTGGAHQLRRLPPDIPRPATAQQYNCGCDCWSTHAIITLMPGPGMSIRSASNRAGGSLSPTPTACSWLSR